ncbi:hypothetical protein HAZT_HAZT002576 [Hyalella azteca]|uniref:Uncharacterized protein n=1 Tax=Hyalella azteca TaxID=294128 RepID=A0A6A0GZ49_HYAAZ|nr:hypothetical protein HAZT_HAZT002576 [Hyalella azteca]
MNTSIAANEDPTVIGRKGRAMERKLMKGFNIGRVEGIVNEILTETKKPGNIFGKLAHAIGSRRKSVKTDWNAKVHRSSMRRDQIGSSSTSLSRSQASIRKRIQFENEQLLQSMNPSNITEYNPNVGPLPIRGYNITFSFCCNFFINVSENQDASDVSKFRDEFQASAKACGAFLFYFFISRGQVFEANFKNFI